MPRQIIRTGLGEQEYITNDRPIPAGATERLITLGSYTAPSAWHTPDASTSTSVSLLIGPGHLDPVAGRYWVHWRYKDVDGEVITGRSFNSVTIDTGGGVPLDPAVRSLAVQPTPPDPSVLVWFDTSTVPPILKYWDGDSWEPLPGSSSGSPNVLFGAGVYGAGVYSPAA